MDRCIDIDANQLLKRKSYHLHQYGWILRTLCWVEQIWERQALHVPAYYVESEKKFVKAEIKMRVGKGLGGGKIMGKVGKR